jgi:hypothetical protein
MMAAPPQRAAASRRVGRRPRRRSRWGCQGRRACGKGCPTVCWTPGKCCSSSQLALAVAGAARAAGTARLSCPWLAATAGAAGRAAAAAAAVAVAGPFSERAPAAYCACCAWHAHWRGRPGRGPGPRAPANGMGPRVPPRWRQASRRQRPGTAGAPPRLATAVPGTTARAASGWSLVISAATSRTWLALSCRTRRRSSCCCAAAGSGHRRAAHRGCPPPVRPRAAASPFARLHSGWREQRVALRRPRSGRRSRRASVTHRRLPVGWPTLTFACGRHLRRPCSLRLARGTRGWDPPARPCKAWAPGQRAAAGAAPARWTAAGPQACWCCGAHEARRAPATSAAAPAGVGGVAVAEAAAAAAGPAAPAAAPRSAARGRWRRGLSSWTRARQRRRSAWCRGWQQKAIRTPSSPTPGACAGCWGGG